MASQEYFQEGSCILLTCNSVSTFFWTIFIPLQLHSSFFPFDVYSYKWWRPWYPRRVSLFDKWVYLPVQCNYSQYTDRWLCPPAICPNVLCPQQECHCHTAPPSSLPPMAGQFQFFHSGNRRKGPKLPFKNLNLIFLCFYWTRRSAESSSSWTGWLYQGLGRVLQENGYVLHFFFYTLNWNI